MSTPQAEKGGDVSNDIIDALAETKLDNIKLRARVVELEAALETRGDIVRSAAGMASGPALDRILAAEARVAELEAETQPVGTFIASDTHPPPYTTAREEVVWLRGLGEKEAAALNEEFQRAERAEARVAELYGALEFVIERMGTHYAHNDPQGTGGTNCPACIDQRVARDRARAALAAARKETP